MKLKLIVGLGNPGRAYANNRHNIGFMCLNHFAKTNDIWFDKKQGQARIGNGIVAGSEVVLAKPQTYMNLSGQSVSRLIKRFDINLNDLLVVHDDLDLPLGKIRIRRGGSSGGHKGVNSIIAEVGSQDFIRLKVGIGRLTASEADEFDTIAYVLGDFTAEEDRIMAPVIPMVSEAIFCLLSEGLAKAMNRYN